MMKCRPGSGHSEPEHSGGACWLRGSRGCADGRGLHRGPGIADTVAMRLLLLASIVLATAGSTPARADGGPFGLGIILGTPTGITGAYELSAKTAIDAAVGLDLIEDQHLYVHVDFLFKLPDLLSGGSVGLSPYLGVGGFLTDFGNKADDRVGLGARVPFGLSLDFRRAPLQIFGEAVVGMLLVPDVDFGISGALGFRYYF